MSYDEEMDYVNPQHVGSDICQTIGPALRRVPEQARSWANVDHVLYAAQQMMLAGGYEEVQQNAAAICEKAGIQIGTFYTYFENSEAVLEALRLLWIHNFYQIIDDCFEVPCRTWQDVATRVVETGIASFESPIVRDLYIVHATTPTARKAELGANAYLGRKIRETIEALGCRFIGDEVDEMMLVEVSDRLCRVSFSDSDDGEGQRRYLDRVRRIVLTLLGSMVSCP